MRIPDVGGYPYAPGHDETLIGYARCSTDAQDLTAQRDRLRDLGVAEDRIYLDHGLTGTNRNRPGLGQALAAVRAGDTLVVPKLDRLARSVTDARAIGDDLAGRGIKLSLGVRVYDPADPMGKMFFNILATFAEVEVDLLRMRTCEGMAVARAKGKLRGKQPKLSARQQRELARMVGTGRVHDRRPRRGVYRLPRHRLPHPPANPGSRRGEVTSRAATLHSGNTAAGLPPPASGRSPLPGRDPNRCFCAGWCREPMSNWPSSTRRNSSVCSCKCQTCSPWGCAILMS